MRFFLSLALLACFALNADACGKRRAAAAASFDTPSSGFAAYSSCSSCQPAATYFARPASPATSGPTYFVPGNCPGGFCPLPTLTKPLHPPTKLTSESASTAPAATVACVCDIAGGCDCSACKCREFSRPAKPLTALVQIDETPALVLPIPTPMLPVPVPVASR